MRLLINVNGIDVWSAKPNIPVELACMDIDGLLGNPRYVVKDAQGHNLIDQEVARNFFGNSWYDWRAPADEGEYTFSVYFADYSSFLLEHPDLLEQVKQALISQPLVHKLTVSSGAPTPIPGGEGYIPPAASPGETTPPAGTLSPTTPPTGGGYTPAPATPTSTGALLSTGGSSESGGDGGDGGGVNWLVVGGLALLAVLAVVMTTKKKPKPSSE